MELTRRAFLQAVFGASLGASLLNGACRRAPTREIPGSLLGQNAAFGHMLRKDLPDQIAALSLLPAEPVGVLVVGGGPAGLSAAYWLAKLGYTDYRLLELEDTVGGTSRGGSSDLTAFPWGAHYLPVPQRENSELVELLREMGVASGMDVRGQLQINEPYLVRKPEERLFYKGYWYPGLYPQAGASAQDLAELARFEALVASWVERTDGRGRRAFTLPLSRASDDASFTEFDQISARELLRRHRFESPRLLWFLDYACRDDYGLRLEDTSAWALLFYFAARKERGEADSSDLITWPEGNQALAKHLARASHERIQGGSAVLDVAETPAGVQVLAWDAAQQRGRRWLAKRVIVATPHFIARRIVRPLRELGTPSAFRYAPWVVANLHLRERPASRGTPLAWDNVLYESPALGYVCATHQRGSDYGRSVWTYYLPLTDATPAAARNELLSADHALWRDAVLADLGRAHANLAECVERLDVFRWGHAMIRPEVGFVWSHERRHAAQPLGSVHFAHSDLSALPLFEEAFDHGLRAAREVLSALRGSEPT